MAIQATNRKTLTTCERFFFIQKNIRIYKILTLDLYAFYKNPLLYTCRTNYTLNAGGIQEMKKTNGCLRF